jgi:HK97 family phage portal protein
MALFDFLRAAPRYSDPRASFQSDGPGVLITDSGQLEQAMRGGNLSEAGIAVTPETAMRNGAVYGCTRLLSSPVATLPFDIKRRIDDRVRQDASDHWAWPLLRKRPNQWQRPHEFKRMMQANVLLRGNAFAYKVRGAGKVQALIPLDPARIVVRQLDDWSVVFDWTRKNGSKVTLTQDEVFHLFCLTINGYSGVTPLTYARETIGTSLAMDRHVGRVLKKGARHSGVAQTDKSLTDKAFSHLKESLGEFSEGGSREGEVMILEEGLKFEQVSMTPQDLQWIEAQKLGRSAIAMYYGVPPWMIGDNSGGDSNWGTGLELKSNAFIAYTLEDYLTMWEEAVNADLLDGDPQLYARFNRAALVRGDIKTRSDFYAKGLQWGWFNPDEVRGLEDMNPRDDGSGTGFYPPPNTAGKDPNADPSEPDPFDNPDSNKG